MPRTVLNPARRFAVRGSSEALFVPLDAMEDGELTAAALDGDSTVDLTGEIVPPISGFSLTQADIAAPDLGSMQTGTVPGEITTADSSMTFYLSKDGDDVRQVLITGAEGFIVIADAGLTAGNLADVYPVTVKYGAKQRDELARIVIPFSVGTNVRENVVIPA